MLVQLTFANKGSLLTYSQCSWCVYATHEIVRPVTPTVSAKTASEQIHRVNSRNIPCISLHWTIYTDIHVHTGLLIS